MEIQQSLVKQNEIKNKGFFENNIDNIKLIFITISFLITTALLDSHKQFLPETVVPRCSIKKAFSQISQKKTCGVSFSKSCWPSITPENTIKPEVFWCFQGFQKTCNFTKKRPHHKCFPGNFAKFSRTPILKNICKRLLLFFYNESHEMLCNGTVTLQESSFQPWKLFPRNCKEVGGKFELKFSFTAMYKWV